MLAVRPRPEAPTPRLPTAQAKAADVVRSLLAVSPEAARQQDSDHWTPLHHAIEQEASLAVLCELLAAWPESARHPSVGAALAQNPEPRRRRRPRPRSASSPASSPSLSPPLSPSPYLSPSDGTLPLHVAVASGASLEVLETLLEAHPDGVREADGEGLLPLHLALEHSAPDETVLGLLRAWPEACTIRDGDSAALPLHIAVQSHASARLLRALLAAHPEAVRLGDGDGTLPLHMALEHQARQETWGWGWGETPSLDPRRALPRPEPQPRTRPRAWTWTPTRRPSRQSWGCCARGRARAQSATPTAACRCTLRCRASPPSPCCARCSTRTPTRSRTQTPTGCCPCTWPSSTRCHLPGFAPTPTPPSDLHHPPPTPYPGAPLGGADAAARMARGGAARDRREDACAPLRGAGQL